MFTDDHLRREIDDILNRKPDATRKEIVAALYWRATLKWGRVPETVKVWYREYNSPAEILAKYSPDQPRVPAGNSDGGQWTRDPNASEGGREAREAAKPKVRAANASEGGRDANAAARLAARNNALLEEVSRPGSKYDVLKNPDGTFVHGPTGELVKFPKEFPPSFFVEQGQKNSVFKLVPLGPIGIYTAINLYWSLSNFGMNQQWDLQRTFNETSSSIDHSLRDYSTIAIGLFAYGASISPIAISYLQDRYAKYKDNKYASDDPIGWFGYLPQRNIDNTYIGYELGKSLDAVR